LDHHAFPDLRDRDRDGRQRASYSGGVSGICVSVRKAFGGFKPFCKPGEMISGIIFMLNSTELF
jgi:hypothetical protein